MGDVVGPLLCRGVTVASLHICGSSLLEKEMLNSCASDREIPLATDLMRRVGMPSSPGLFVGSTERRTPSTSVDCVSRAVKILSVILGVLIGGTGSSGWPTDFLLSDTKKLFRAEQKK